MIWKWKVHRDPTSETLGMYELKMALFEDGDLDELLLFIHNFDMNIEASGTLISNAKLQYLHTLLHGEELRQFDT